MMQPEDKLHEEISKVINNFEKSLNCKVRLCTIRENQYGISIQTQYLDLNTGSTRFRKTIPKPNMLIHSEMDSLKKSKPFEDGYL